LDEAGEVMLPDDLAALGDRLRHDADVLAAQYPAREINDDGRVPLPRPGRKSAAARRYWLATATVAGVLLAVAVWPSMNRLMRHSSDMGTLVTESPSRNIDNGSSPPPTAHSIGVINADVQPVDYSSDRSIQGTPAVFLQDVSGPELEGLLDLWEQEPAAASGVSI